MKNGNRISNLSKTQLEAFKTKLLTNGFKLDENNKIVRIIGFNRENYEKR